MKKTIFPIIFLAFIFFAGQVAAAQEWIEPKSPAELIGLWESSTTLPISANPEEAVPESSIGLIIIFDFKEPGEKKDNTFKLSIRLDMSKFLDDFMFLPEVKALSMSKDALWNFLMQSMQSAAKNYDVIFGKYFVSYTVSENISEFFTKSDHGTIFINQARNRMLISFNEDLSQGLSNQEVREVILIKR